MRLTVTGIVVAMLILTSLCLREWSLMPDGRTHIRFLDVGQGDSILFQSRGGNSVLIDGGPDWSTLERLGETLPFFRRTVDLVILTHPDLDHIGALPEMIRRYRIGGLILPPSDDRSPLYQSLLAAAEIRHVPVRYAVAGETITVDDITTFTVLWPPRVLPRGFSKQGNNHSLLLMLTAQAKRILLTSDIEEPVEKTLVAAHADLRADILKVGHHGSRTSSGTGFLLAVHPSNAIISVGKDNLFGHPRPEIVKRFKNLGIPIQRTDEKGTVDVHW